MKPQHTRYVIARTSPGGFEKFAGKAKCNRILVTGATSTIGFSLLREFMSSYKQLTAIVSSRDIDKLNYMVENLEKEIRLRVEILELPNTSRDIPQFVSRIDGIDSAIVCQGSYGVLGHFNELDLEQLADSFNSQLRSILVTLRALCNTDISGLRVIVLGGGGASKAYEGLSEYGMLKSSIARLVETISLEIPKEKLLINLLGPGATYSEMSEYVLKRVSESVRVDNRIIEASQNLNVKKTGISRNLVNACEYLLNPASNFISGKFISADWDTPSQLATDTSEDSYTLRRIIPDFESL